MSYRETLLYKTDEEIVKVFEIVARRQHEKIKFKSVLRKNLTSFCKTVVLFGDIRIRMELYEETLKYIDSKVAQRELFEEILMQLFDHDYLADFLGETREAEDIPEDISFTSVLSPFVVAKCCELYQEHYSLTLEEMLTSDIELQRELAQGLVRFTKSKEYKNEQSSNSE